jgi:hypothetical protein
MHAEKRFNNPGFGEGMGNERTPVSMMTSSNEKCIFILEKWMLI